MKTGVFLHPIFGKHDTGPGHPESLQRYNLISAELEESDFFNRGVIKLEPEKASKGIVLSTHSKELFRKIETAVRNGFGFLDSDTVVSMHSLDAALYAAGAAINAVDAVITGEIDRAFVAARPPGHHATRERSMGFCLFNNAAIAANYARQKYKEIERIAIIDWDVHHGNGTQGIFYEERDVFFFSVHQYPWYPGTGARGETGSGKGLGTTLNVPLKAFTPAAIHRSAFEAAISEIAGKIKPDLIIISAGFDAHISDPLGQLQLEDLDFQMFTKVVLQWAEEVCIGRVISFLEGGYNLETLPKTVKSHIKALAGSE
jgi:acetoin utilization deacetylase AcuC-like enzyme